jgi:hypothetical protein
MSRAQARRQPPGAAKRLQKPVQALKSMDDSVVTSSPAVAPEFSSEQQESFRDAMLASMSERELQQHVRDGLEARGWWVFVIPVMLMTRAGWPDIAAIHPQKPGRLLLWELKRERGRVSQDQTVVLTTLAPAEGVDARIVRPRDWLTLKEVV